MYFFIICIKYLQFLSTSWQKPIITHICNSNITVSRSDNVLRNVIGNPVHLHKMSNISTHAEHNGFIFWRSVKNCLLLSLWASIRPSKAGRKNGRVANKSFRTGWGFAVVL